MTEFTRRQLLLVAGLSMAGKTTIITKIARREMTGQFKNLGLDDIHDWENALTNELFRNPACRPNRLIVHFDLYAQIQMLARHEWMKRLLAEYDEVYSLTLCTHHKEFKSRIGFRLSRLLTKRWPFIKYRKALKILNPRSDKKAFYSRLANIRDLYQQYDDILANHPSVRARWMMDTSKLDNDMILPMDKTRLLALLADGTNMEVDSDHSKHRSS